MDLCSLCWGKKANKPMTGKLVHERPESPTYKMNAKTLENLAREHQVMEEANRNANYIIDLSVDQPRKLGTGEEAMQGQFATSRALNTDAYLQQGNANNVKPDAQPNSKEEYVYLERDNLEKLLKESSAYASQKALNEMLLQKKDEVEKRIDTIEAKIAELEEKQQTPRDESHVEFKTSNSSDSVSSLDTEPLETEKKSYEEHVSLGKEAFADGMFSKAKQHFVNAVRLATEIGDKRSMARAEANVSNAQYQLGKFKSSLVHFERAIKCLREMGETKLECCLIPNGILICIQLGELDQATGLALRKLSLASTEEEKDEAKLWIDKTNRAIDAQETIDITTS